MGIDNVTSNKKNNENNITNMTGIFKNNSEYSAK